MTNVGRFRTVEDEVRDYLSVRDDMPGPMRKVLDRELGGITLVSARRIDAMMRDLFPNYPSTRNSPTRNGW